MNSRQIADLVDGGIPFFIGILLTLYGHRVLGRKLGVDPVYDERNARRFRLLRWIGPLILALGVVQCIGGIMLG